jgi:cell division protein FtsB
VAVAAPRARPAERHASTPAVPAPSRSVRQARPRSRPRARPRPRLTRWVVWIAAVAALLAGIVALNVAALELRLERGRLQSQIVEIRTENAAIETELSRAAAVGRVEAAARGRLGLVEASETTYLRLERRR